MKLSLEEKVSLTKVLHLYKHVGVLAFIHPIIGLMLCAIFWNSVPLNYIGQWFAGLMLIVLARSLSFLKFKRLASDRQGLKRYEVYSLIFSFLSGLCYGLAFVYLAYTQAHEVHTTIALMAIMLIGVSAFGFVSSMKDTAAFSLPVFLPLIAFFGYLMSFEGYMIASILLLYAIVLFRSMVPISSSLNDLFELRIVHEEAGRTIEELESRFRELTVEDTTTHIFNRRFFDMTINNELRRAKRNHTNLSLVILDIDCFKDYVNRYGMELGDRCLGAVAGILKSSVQRGGEFVTRFDGDKFGLVLPNTNADEAERFALKLQDIVLRANIEHKATQVQGLNRISVSAGISELDLAQPPDRKDMVARAEMALKHAKQMGRCTIVVHRENMDAAPRQALSLE